MARENDIFAKFNKLVDGKALAEGVKEIQENGGSSTGDVEYKEVPHGDYEVKIEKMEIKACKSEANKGLPMFSVQFRILDGEYKKSCIFMNKLLTSEYPIHIVNEFLRSLDSGIDVEFNGDFGNYNNLILDIHEEITTHKLEYLVAYDEDKGYDTFEILEVYES